MKQLKGATGPYCFALAVLGAREGMVRARDIADHGRNRTQLKNNRTRQRAHQEQLQ